MWPHCFCLWLLISLFTTIMVMPLQNLFLFFALPRRRSSCANKINIVMMCSVCISRIFSNSYSGSTVHLKIDTTVVIRINHHIYSPQPLGAEKNRYYLLIVHAISLFFSKLFLLVLFRLLYSLSILLLFNFLWDLNWFGCWNTRAQLFAKNMKIDYKQTVNGNYIKSIAKTDLLYCEHGDVWCFWLLFAASYCHWQWHSFTCIRFEFVSRLIYFISLFLFFFFLRNYEKAIKQSAIENF